MNKITKIQHHQIQLSIENVLRTTKLNTVSKLAKLRYNTRTNCGSSQFTLK